MYNNILLCISKFLLLKFLKANRSIFAPEKIKQKNIIKKENMPVSDNNCIYILCG